MSPVGSARALKEPSHSPRKVVTVRRLLFVAAAVLTLAPHAAAAVDPMSWTSYGYDNQLGNAIQTKTLTQEAVRRLQLSWSAQLDGPVFAQPLAATVNRQLLIYAATEAGSVYAVSATTGKTVWKRELGVVQTLECGTWGITSTGAIDLERRLLFEISADGVLHALDLATGQEAPGYPLTLITNNLYEYVWGGLRIANGRLYVVNASYCDVGPPGDLFPEGRLFSIPLAQPQALATWDPVPGLGNLGGMWGWGGVSVDPATGRLFTGVGNSSVWSEECGCYVDNAGYGNKRRRAAARSLRRRRLERSRDRCDRRLRLRCSAAALPAAGVPAARRDEQQERHALRLEP